MIPISFARNLFITALFIFIAILLIALATVSAQARLGSEEIEETGADPLARIMTIIGSIVRSQKEHAEDFEAELVVPLQDWPLDRKALHEQLMTMIRNTLTMDLAIGNGAGEKNSEQVFILLVPENTAELHLNTQGGSGDIDLYVMRDNIPTTSRYDCRSTAKGTRQSCSIKDPAQGTYYVMLRGNARYDGVSVTSTYQLEPGKAPELPMDSPAIGAAETGRKPPRI